MLVTTGGPTFATDGHEPGIRTRRNLTPKPPGVSGVKEEKTEHIVHDADGTIEKRTDFRNVTDSTGEGDQHEGHQ